MIGQQGIPARHGGVERVCEELGARLAETGHRVVMFNSLRGPKPHQREYRGIQLRWVPSTAGKRTGNLTLSLVSTVIVLFGRYDVVHYHAMGPCIFSPLLRLRRRMAIVATIHGRDDQRAKWGRGARVLLSRAAVTSAKVPDEVIVVSRQLQDEYRRQFGRETRHVPNGAAAPPAQLRTSHPSFQDEPRPYLLALGRLVPEKAFDDLIAAFRELDHDLDLAIVGGSSHTDDHAERLAELAAPDRRIHLLGRVYGEELVEFLAGAQGFVTASHLEGMPLTLLEAASHALPVACSDLPVHLDILGPLVGEPGHRVFPVGDRPALREAMEAMIADPETEAAGGRALRDHVLATYSWTRMTLETLEVYADALRRRYGRVVFEPPVTLTERTPAGPRRSRQARRRRDDSEVPA